MDQEERKEFVAKHRTAMFGFGRKDHGPAMSIVYYVMDGGDILVSTIPVRGSPTESLPMQHADVGTDAWLCRPPRRISVIVWNSSRRHDAHNTPASAV
jgi:hypothetical protein